MNWTAGEMLFYGGAVGMVGTALAAILATVLLSGSRKRLRRKLNEEYGVHTSNMLIIKICRHSPDKGKAAALAGKSGEKLLFSKHDLKSYHGEIE